MLSNNSIIRNLSQESTVNEIRLLLSVPQNKYKTIILFEGLNDIKLFCSLLNNKNTYFFESYGGKPAIKNILNYFSQENRLIGIADKDYENLNTYKLFFCDYCNAEMMIISNDDALKYTLFNITNSIIDVNTLRIKILNKLIFFSMIRKLNEDYNWGINLSIIPIIEILRPTNISELRQLVNFINIKNPENIINDERFMLIQSLYKCLKNENLLNYTNGHDFCTALIMELKSSFPKSKVKSINTDEMASFLRMGYRISEFKLSNLYNMLLDYQQQYNLKIVD